MDKKNVFATPADIFGELFLEMHKSGIWSDGKAVSDALPLVAPEKILETFEAEKEKENFDLKAFVSRFFQFQTAENTNFKSDKNLSVEAHIQSLWPVLTRNADKTKPGDSLLPLPFTYIVPGGRFNEIYYWDSYFTMLGLLESGRLDLIENMIDNFSHLIQKVGFIPNGNRTYFLGRSQPPFFALMVELLAEKKGDEILKKYFHFLEKEYSFWMDGTNELSEDHQVEKRVVWLNNGEILNRYWDNFDAPRAEMFSDDIHLSQQSGREPNQLFKDLRAACESGWDFSSRWLRQADDLSTIHTTEIIPTDLNCLLWNLENTLSRVSKLVGQNEKSDYYQKQANRRKALIHKYLWSEKDEFFMDFDFVKKASKSVIAASGMFPLFFKLANNHQAIACAAVLKNQLTFAGGVVCTPHFSGQQWDAPNGWAPLQWIAINGLRNYGFVKQANELTQKWLNLNQTVFKKTGKMLEKYNVIDTNLETGGGEYPVQDGFGWTNGVYLALKAL